jgi:hypothetical protein
MAAWQVLEAAADQKAAVLQRFVGIGEIHLLFYQKRAQMLVDLLERGVFERFIGSPLRPFLFDFIQSGLVLEDLDAGELFEDPGLCCVVLKLSLFRLEPLVHCNDRIKLFDIGARIECQAIDQC